MFRSFGQKYMTSFYHFTKRFYPESVYFVPFRYQNWPYVATIVWI